MRNFWEIIERVRMLVHDSNLAYFDAISAVLDDLSPQDIAAFDRSFFEATCQLDTTKFFAAAMIIKRGLVSDDGFEYFKNWIVLQGRNRFERTVENPDSLADLITADVDLLFWEVESVGAATFMAYERKTGRDMETDFPDTSGQHEADFDNSKAASSAARKQLPRLVRAMKNRR